MTLVFTWRNHNDRHHYSPLEDPAELTIHAPATPSIFQMAGCRRSVRTRRRPTDLLRQVYQYWLAKLDKGCAVLLVYG